MGKQANPSLHGFETMQTCFCLADEYKKTMKATELVALATMNNVQWAMPWSILQLQKPLNDVIKFASSHEANEGSRC